MNAPKQADTQKPAATPRAPRQLRTKPAGRGLLAVAKGRTGDAPEKAPAETPEAAVAVAEPGPELTWYPTIGDMVAAKFARWREATPAPVPAPVAEADLPPLPPLPKSPRPVGLTASDEEFLAKNATQGTDPGEGMDMRRERVFGPLDAWLDTSPKPAPAATEVPRALTLAELAQGVEDGTYRLTFGDDGGPDPWEAAEKHHEGEHDETLMWTLPAPVAELGDDGCAEGEPPGDAA